MQSLQQLCVSYAAFAEPYRRGEGQHVNHHTAKGPYHRAMGTSLLELLRHYPETEGLQAEVKREMEKG